MQLPVIKNLKGRRAVVLGSGPAGLTAAIALASRGARVHLLETDAAVGGTLRPPTHEEVALPAWPGFVVQPRLLAGLFADAGYRISEFLTFTPLKSLSVRLGADDVTAWPGGDLRLPGTGRLAGWLEAGREEWAFHRGRGVRGQLALTRALPALAAATLPPCDAVMARWMARDPRARRTLLALALLLGATPARTTGHLIREVSRLAREGLWRADGPPAALLNSLLRLAELCNVQIATGATVRRIVLESGRVRRVEGDGFPPLAASLVVLAEDAPSELARLLPEHVGRRPRRRAPDASVRVVRLDLRTAEPIPELAPVTLLPSEEPIEELRFLDRWRLPATQPGAVVLRGDDPKRLSIYTRVPTPGPRFRWDEMRRLELRDRLVNLVLSRHPQPKKGIEVVAEQMSDPAEALQLHPVWGGEHRRAWHETPPNRVAGVGGLYRAGDGVHPGGGLDATMLSGVLAAQCASEDARGG
jgi:phytoene dehydrogenase-like protein